MEGDDGNFRFDFEDYLDVAGSGSGSGSASASSDAPIPAGEGPSRGDGRGNFRQTIVPTLVVWAVHERRLDHTRTCTS